MRDINCEGSLGRCILEPSSHSQSSPAAQQDMSPSTFDSTLTPVRRVRRRTTHRRRSFRPRKIQVGGSRRRTRVSRVRRGVQYGGGYRRRSVRRNIRRR